MKTVVVGGHSRNIGKTSVMAGLIRDLKSLRWTAVKITQYGHGICSHDGQPCECAPAEHPFALTEELDAAGRSDTSRFLQAGARRSLWLRVRQGQLAQALPLLKRTLAGDECVMIESNSILELMKPSVYLAVLDSRQTDFKPSALKFLSLADALVPIASGHNAVEYAWQGLDHQLLKNMKTFPVNAGDFSSHHLSEFVREKLSPTGKNQGTKTRIKLTSRKRSHRVRTE
jgi:hypothetical protein